MRLPDLSDGRQLDTSLEQVSDLCFSQDGTLLAAVGGVPSEAGGVEVFTWPAGERQLQITPGNDVVYAVAWGPGDEWLVVSGFDGITRIVDAETGRLQGELPGHSRPVTTVCTLPDTDRTLLVTGSADQTLRVWDALTSAPVRTLHNHTLAVHALAVRPTQDGVLPTIASVSDDRTVRLWQPTIGRLVRFARLPAVPLCLQWLPDGTRIVVGCHDGRLRCIDPATGVITDDLPVSAAAILCLDVEQEGRSLVVGDIAGGLCRLTVPQPASGGESSE